MQKLFHDKEEELEEEKKNFFDGFHRRKYCGFRRSILILRI